MKSKSLKLVLLSIVIVLIHSQFCLVFSGDLKNLSIGWEPWEPYQYEKDQKVTGLDIDLVTAILDSFQCKLNLKKLVWKRHLEFLEMGEIDLAAGASITPDREKFAYFSNAYRTESAVLYVRKGESSKYSFSKLEDIVGTPFKLGITRDYYYGEDVKKLMENPKAKHQIEEVHQNDLNFKKLLTKRIDGFLSDPIAATFGLRNEGVLDQVEVHPLFIFSNDIYIMFSKKSTTPEIVKVFNDNLAKLKANGTIDQILNRYLK
ncbi:MAG: amino acid ABC transporter substrate-binding protein [Desulfobacterales bacterium]|nr:amino acid ABC transporter substrate-binding protein [Desulfobacterales bacterium]